MQGIQHVPSRSGACASHKALLLIRMNSDQIYIFRNWVQLLPSYTIYVKSHLRLAIQPIKVACQSWLSRRSWTISLHDTLTNTRVFQVGISNTCIIKLLHLEPLDNWLSSLLIYALQNGQHIYFQTAWHILMLHMTMSVRLFLMAPHSSRRQ